jgi:hypothetical protein
MQKELHILAVAKADVVVNVKKFVLHPFHAELVIFSILKVID